jgi:hypothetical protein
MKRDNQHTAEMAQALEAKPPRIRWAPNGRGIQVATEIEDPHTKKPWRQYDDRPLPQEHSDRCRCVNNEPHPDCPQHWHTYDHERINR